MNRVGGPCAESLPSYFSVGFFACTNEFSATEGKPRISEKELQKNVTMYFSCLIAVFCF